MLIGLSRSYEDYLGFVFMESGNYVKHITLIACFGACPGNKAIYLHLPFHGAICVHVLLSYLMTNFREQR